jgi:hypothetical protein
VVAVLEQHQAECGLGVEMPFARGALEPGLRRAEVERNTATEPESLAEVERRVVVAFFRQRPPDAYGARMVAALPRMLLPTARNLAAARPQRNRVVAVLTRF